MTSRRDVTIEHEGKQYGAAYTITNGMLHVRTHTETRSVEVGEENPEALARRVLSEIVNSQPNG